MQATAISIALSAAALADWSELRARSSASPAGVAVALPLLAVRF
jgi:hypothetical protein